MITDRRQNQTLGIATNDKRLSILVDGAIMEELELAQFPQGSVGVYVDTPGLTVLFSNPVLTVKQ